MLVLISRGCTMLHKFKGLFHKDSLEDKIPLVIVNLETALNRLDRISESLRKEDNELFERCVKARLENDAVHAMMYANECAEMRKIALLVVSSKYALEQMVLRLQTVAKLGSILVTVSPVVDVIKETRSRLVGIVPNVANNLNEANKILVNSLVKMGTSSVGGVKPLVYSEDAEKVLDEAKIAAEETIRERFPKIPETLRERMLKQAELLAS
jgi:division protein CdvB (Snf7/Vps24/ESCRT-III family)